MRGWIALYTKPRTLRYAENEAAGELLVQVSHIQSICHLPTGEHAGTRIATSTHDFRVEETLDQVRALIAAALMEET